MQHTFANALHNWDSLKCHCHKTSPKNPSTLTKGSGVWRPGELKQCEIWCTVVGKCTIAKKMLSYQSVKKEFLNKYNNACVMINIAKGSGHKFSNFSIFFQQLFRESFHLLTIEKLSSREKLEIHTFSIFQQKSERKKKKDMIFLLISLYLGRNCN